MEVGTATWQPGLRTPVKQQAEVAVPFGVIDPDSQEKTRLRTHSGGWEEYVWNSGASLGHLRTPMHCDKIQWKSTTAESTRSANGPGPSGRKV